MTEELIAKLEALEAPDAEVFRMVATKCHGSVPAAFNNMLNCQAWESAAIMLVPEGYAWGMDARHCSAILTRLSAFEHEFAQHPAIALLICILKAKEPVE